MKKKNLIILLLIPFVIALLAIGGETIKRIALENELVDIEWNYKEVEDFEFSTTPYELDARPVMKKKTTDDFSNLLTWQVENENKEDTTEYVKVYYDENEKKWYLKTLKITGINEVIVSCSNGAAIIKSMKVVIWDMDNAAFAVTPVISASQSNIDKNVYYGEYDITNYVKTKAKIAFNVKVFPESFSSMIYVVNTTDNINFNLDTKEVTVKEAGDASFTLGLTKEGLTDPYTYNLKIVKDGVNVFNYQDLLYCTNYSDNGEIVVLRKSLESLENAYEFKGKDILLDNEGNPVRKKNNVDIFGSYNIKKESYYFSDEVYRFTTTYNKNYIDQWNEYVKSKGSKNTISDQVIAGLRVQKDFYGNGYTLNLHNLTFPTGKITETIDGEDYIIATLSPRDIFRGPLPFYTLGDHNGLALVEAYGQDNIGMYIDGDNITINDINLKSCDVGFFMSNLETVGTTLETHGNNITIKNSKISNGKTVVRSFSSMDTVIDNCYLSTAYNFLVSIGSNEYIKFNEDEIKEFVALDGSTVNSSIKEYFKKTGPADNILNGYLTADFESKTKMRESILSLQRSFNQKEMIENIYKGSLKINNTYLYKSNIASIGIESMFNGPFLYSYIPSAISEILGYLETSDGTKLSDFQPTNLSGVSYPVKVELTGKTKFYDYKTKDTLDINGLIKENISTFAKQLGGKVDYSGEINIDKIFPIKEYLFNAARAANNLYTVDNTEYINVPVAFYGGGLNLSSVTFDTVERSETFGSALPIDLLENYLNLPAGSSTVQTLKNMMLKSVTVVTGFEPFKFICMDNSGYLFNETPKVSDLIDNAKGD